MVRNERSRGHVICARIKAPMVSDVFLRSLSILGFHGLTRSLRATTLCVRAASSRCRGDSLVPTGGLPSSPEKGEEVTEGSKNRSRLVLAKGEVVDLPNTSDVPSLSPLLEAEIDVGTNGRGDIDMDEGEDEDDEEEEETADAPTEVNIVDEGGGLMSLLQRNAPTAAPLPSSMMAGSTLSSSFFLSRAWPRVPAIMDRIDFFARSMRLECSSSRAKKFAIQS